MGLRVIFIGLLCKKNLKNCIFCSWLFVGGRFYRM